MKRFSPYTKYKMNGKTRYTSVAPDGKRRDSAAWHADRIREIRYIFLQKNKNNQFRLKPYQKEIMTSILSGNDTFVILPTGSGKSLCFQAPSVFFPGITLVITPLVALIENQVEHFNKNAFPLYHPFAKNYYENIRFKAIYPGMDGLSTQAMFSEILNPRENSGYGREIQYKFLYVSPERLSNPKFLRMLKCAEQNGLRIDHVVIDEVHCMSQWGFEFRESYLHIMPFLNQRPVRPIISAFTATATPKDIAEIKNILHFPGNQAEYGDKKYREIFHMAKRTNLSLRVLPCSDYDAGEGTVHKDGRGAFLKTRQDTLMDILEENRTKVCIIYRTTASGVDELCHTLKNIEWLKDRVVKYHAQMPEHARSRNKGQFENSYDESAKEGRESDSSPKPCKNIMIATKAFGMGIDKKDISLVIHYDMPRSLEDYYQEVGRAGRDAEQVPAANCYLLYSVGPKKEKGTLQYTIQWVTSGKNAPGSGCMPISSQFSDKTKEMIYFWSYYRLCYMMKYCNIAGRNPGAAQDFILKYLENRFSADRIVSDLNYFYDYIVKYYPVSPGKRERFLTECLFRGTDALRFPGVGSGQDGKSAAQYHAEIRQLTDEINELHINNTYLANLLRHHPEKYQPGVPYVLSEDLPGSGQEWKSKQNRQVKGAESMSLRPSDINRDTAFLFVSNPHTCEDYVNAAWNMRRNCSIAADLIFTVDYHHIINGILTMQDGRWKLLTDREAVLPYARYLGRHVKGLFPKKRYGLWRKTKKSSRNPEDPEAIGSADSLFAYVPGAKAHELTFTIHGSEKLSYFDLCVLDAIYTVEAFQRETIYVQTIWELLTGRNPGYSSREKLRFRTTIQDSIDKMRAMSISVSDNQCDYEAKEAVLLPLTEKPGGQKGYSYTVIPPLFQYAEEMNGQVIKVPVSLLNVARMGDFSLWKDDFSAEFRYSGPAAYSLDGSQNHAFDHPVKSLPPHMADGQKIRELLSPKDFRRLDHIKAHPCLFRPSIETALLCHYLVHRIAISKNTKRSNYILFSTVKSITGICEDSCLFQKKAVALMNHYQKIGYMKQYYLYITDYPYGLTDGNTLTDTAYFRARAAGILKYWRLHDTGHLFMSDFVVTWSWQYNERLREDRSNSSVKTRLADAIRREGRSLSADTSRKLALVSLGRMDGIVLS